MIIVDVETSGINPEMHGLLSIGAVDFLNPDRQFYAECQLWPEAHIMDEALDINGFGREDLRSPDKMIEVDMMEDFKDWVHSSINHTLAGQNPHFGTYFLNAAAHRSGIDLGLPHRVIDLHSVVYSHMILRGIDPPVRKRRSDLNSDTIMDYVGIPPEPRPHQALNGAIWEAEAFHRVFYNQPLFNNFDKFSVPWE